MELVLCDFETIQVYIVSSRATMAITCLNKKRIRKSKKRKVDKERKIDYFSKVILPLYNTKYFPFKNKINETKILIGFFFF